MHFYYYVQQIITTLYKLVLGCSHYVYIELSAKTLELISYYLNNYNLKQI